MSSEDTIAKLTEGGLLDTILADITAHAQEMDDSAKLAEATGESQKALRLLYGVDAVLRLHQQLGEKYGRVDRGHRH